MKHIVSEVTLIFPMKTLIWNKIVSPASNSKIWNLPELVENELGQTLYESTEQCFFEFDLMRLKANAS